MQIITVVRVFSLFLFLFLPSFAVLLLIGFVLRDTHLFVGIGTLVLTVNGIVILLRPVRRRINAQLSVIIG